ncbi:hypothetical protein HGRIS_005678 [Hohenbuehelia grisea]|uniref:PH domain-containing protein n=1 Tax=Hohenbuehelia grisea TaxID=104357 RepID=A0ABR3JXJ9_9AGAR
MSSSLNRTSSATSCSAGSLAGTCNDIHVHRRTFVGPMPEKVVSTTEERVQNRARSLFHGRRTFETLDDGDKVMPKVIRDHAFRFFIKHGGKPEDWGEEEERNAVEEMLHRWKESEWGSVLRRRRKEPETRQTTRWVGGSFEIGNVLGINILEDTPENISNASTSPTSPRRPDSSSVRPSTFAGDSFVTAQTEFQDSPPSTNEAPHVTLNASALPEPLSALNGYTPEHQNGHTAPSPTSSTALLRPSLGLRDDQPPSHARTEVFHRSIIRLPSSFRSDTQMGTLKKGKGKGKSVHYEELSPLDQNGRAPSPAPPGEVLQRRGSEIEETSAGATVVAASQLPVPDDEGIVMRDRMLVRVSFTRKGIEPHFDEVQNRMTDHLDLKDWGEFLVVWHRHRIDLYEDYSLPGKEMFRGHKRVAYAIPLDELDAKTSLSLYSFVDLTFCLSCKPWPRHQPDDDDIRKLRARWKARPLERNVFIFKMKTRTRASDWLWLLWRHFGGHIPRTLKVRNPALDTWVTIDVPQIDLESGTAFRMFNRDNIIALCAKSLRSVPQWKYIVQRQLEQGKTLALAWRSESSLDWIWLEDDVEGNFREWSLLYGLAFKQPRRPTNLEIRLAEHFPSHVVLKTGEHIHEPTAIEGYVDRIKTKTQTRQQVYLATHDGNLFGLTATNAHPPAPPGLQAVGTDPESYAQVFRESEVARGALQLMDAVSVTDLRDIVAVRRAFHVVPERNHSESDQTPSDGEQIRSWACEERQEGDADDEGGDEALSKSLDKANLRMKRGFELLLANGTVIRYEAYSRNLALEWIERLRELIAYWKLRHRFDAHEEMSIAKASRAPVTPKTRVHQNEDMPPEAPGDPNGPMAELSGLYHWCVLEGCKSIIRGGKLYMRRGLRGDFKHVQLFLVSGHLVPFRIKRRAPLRPAMRKINLADAYVCSGYFAALCLPKGQFHPNASVPRRYQDGLEADDQEEDTLFVVWFHPQPPPPVKEGDHQTIAVSETIPALSARRKLVVFKTRSKLERNTWCWALNGEIERIARAHKERETKIRQAGEPVKK